MVLPMAVSLTWVWSLPIGILLYAAYDIYSIRSEIKRDIANETLDAEVFDLLNKK